MKLGNILRRIVFSFGLVYGVDLLLRNTNIYIPMNIPVIIITSLLGIPGLLSIFTIFYIIK